MSTRNLKLLKLMESYDGQLVKLPCGHIVGHEDVTQEGVCLLCQWEADVQAELRARP